jgi:hypothetical protein
MLTAFWIALSVLMGLFVAGIIVLVLHCEWGWSPKWLSKC